MGEEIEKKLLDVPLSEIHVEETPVASLDTSMLEVLKAMRDSRKGAMCLLKNNTAAGMISERDFIQKGVFNDSEWLNRPCQEIATPGPFTLKRDSLVSDAIKMIVKRNFRHVPLVDEQGNYSGLLSIKDLLRFLIQFFPNQVHKHGTLTNWSFQTVDEFGEGFSSSSENMAFVSGNIFLAHLKRVCHERPLIIDIEATVEEAISLMRERKKGSIVVMEYETRIKGIFTERDILFKILGNHEINDKLFIKDFMTEKPHTLLSKHYLAHAINNMFNYKYRSTIVVDEDSYPLALVSLLDIFKFVAFNFYGDEELSLL